MLCVGVGEGHASQPYGNLALPRPASALQPLSVAVMAAVLFGETLSWPAVAGLLVGVAGLGLLNVPGGNLQEAAGAWESEGLGAGPLSA